MVEQLLNHIHRHNLCKTTDKILLAVSGGVDSMVMLDLFVKAGFKIGVAHCNFQLRGPESKADEALVQQVCAARDIPVFTERYNTSEIAAAARESIQVTARRLRYEFFDRVARQMDYSRIATAHQVNDNLETVLLNLTRGTGMDGIVGIPVRNAAIIRPLLFATRESIRSYGVENGLVWREDSSNDSEHYSRNFLRHQVIPKLKELNPNLEHTFAENIERIRAVYEVSKTNLTSILESCVSKEEERVRIDIRRLKMHPAPDALLWEILKNYGFNYDQCKLITKEHQPGKIFIGAGYRLVTDRNDYILEKSANAAPLAVKIDVDETEVSADGLLLRIAHRNTTDFVLQKKVTIGQFDAQKLKFPLIWRSWKDGDSFIPLGMKNRKKISDFLIDARIGLPDKARITVIESGADIIWVVGMRIHDHYKVTDVTSRMVVMEVGKV